MIENQKEDLPMKKNQIAFIAVFTILGLFALQVPFTRLLGSNVKFTLFDFLAPTAGTFLGTAPAILSVLFMQIINLVIHGTKSLEIATVIRLLPTLFAVFYFSRKRTVNLIIPIAAIVGFNLNPIGASAWQYSLFWLIPIAAHFFRKNLFVRSLGATFTAHAVGGVLWVWAFGLTRQMWLSLIPQVIMERTLMAAGIAGFYILATQLMKVLAKQKKFSFLRFLPSN